MYLPISIILIGCALCFLILLRAVKLEKLNKEQEITIKLYKDIDKARTDWIGHSKNIEKLLERQLAEAMRLVGLAKSRVSSLENYIDYLEGGMNLLLDTEYLVEQEKPNEKS